MTKHIKTLLTAFLFLSFLSLNHAAIRVKAPAAGEKAEHSVETPAHEKAETAAAENWLSRKWDKLKKRIERRKARWEKRQARRKAARGEGEGGNGLWHSLAFILGIIFLAGGIILGIAAFSNPLGGFFHLLAGVLVVAGIVMILYAALHTSGA